MLSILFPGHTISNSPGTEVPCHYIGTINSNNLETARSSTCIRSYPTLSIGGQLEWRVARVPGKRRARHFSRNWRWTGLSVCQGPWKEPCWPLKWHGSEGWLPGSGSIEISIAKPFPLAGRERRGSVGSYSSSALCDSLSFPACREHYAPASVVIMQRIHLDPRMV
jgi:hypothetical protein